MKTIKITIIALGLLSSITSCKKGGVFCYGASNTITTESRTINNFDEVELGLAGDVYITKSDVYSVQIEASDNLHDIIQTKVSGSELEIDLKNNKCLKGNTNIKVYITMPELAGLSVSGSGGVYVSSFFDSNSMDIDISGSGEIEMDSLKVNTFEANISGSGEMLIHGIDTCQNQELNISGSGKFRGYDMLTNNSDIDISGSGNCEVNVIESIKARISGSGKVTYKGSPAIDSNISGSGSIQPY
jgi:hypothetical protein